MHATRDSKQILRIHPFKAYHTFIVLVDSPVHTSEVNMESGPKEFASAGRIGLVVNFHYWPGAQPAPSEGSNIISCISNQQAVAIAKAL